MVLYRKYRPQKLSEIFGQDTVVRNLLGALSSGKISHGYLFTGPRGTGKTSAARIFARAVNCETYNPKKPNPEIRNQKFGEPCNKCEICKSMLSGASLDLIEIDAASNRGIDEIRDLREKVKFAPIAAKYKVYIIDEAHMLTNEAFNALLKTLEEPPAHAIFILCTTEFSKLPATIVSRLSRFNFLRANEGQIQKVIAKIAKEEKIKIGDDATYAIARAADGSFRDAISILDQASSGGAVEAEDVEKLAVVTGWNLLLEFTSLLTVKDLKNAVSKVETLAQAGVDISLFVRQEILFLEKLLFLKIGVPDLAGREYDAAQVSQMKKMAEEFEFMGLQNLMHLFLVAEGDIKLYPLPQIPVVLAVCKYCGFSQTKTQEGLSKVSRGKDEVPEPDSKLNEDPKINSLPKIKNKPKGAKKLEDVQNSWGEFLNQVRAQNAHVVALLRSTRPAEFDGDMLTLEVFYSFHKEKLEEHKIIMMLDQILSNILGEQVRLKFVLAKRESEPTKAVRNSNVVEVSEKGIGELEKIANEIFSE